MTTTKLGVPRPISDLQSEIPHYQKVLDLLDISMDIMLNHRQSGHPGGSHSKSPVLVALTLSGAMRWDVRDPTKSFADRFVLVAGHANPMVYAMLAVYNEALRTRYQRTGDERFRVVDEKRFALFPEDLLNLRRRGGLPGHAEMEGKTLFFKFNTGPSGHGSPAAAGEALALKLAGAGEVKVFAMEGEGGHTAGATHETKHTSWGLGLDNLVYLLDWNDFGIDSRPCSAVVPGTPQVWFESYDWKTAGVEDGGDFTAIMPALAETVWGEDDRPRPRCMWFKSIKGRGYGIQGFKSHGAALPRNSEGYWQLLQRFAENYGVTFEDFGAPDPGSPEEARRQAASQLETVMGVLRSDDELLEWLTDRLVGLGESVPEEIAGLRISREEVPSQDPVLTDVANYPAELFLEPGKKAPNRKALAAFGAWVNAHGRKHYGRPLFIACSADLADSTNISGFAHDFGDTKGFGRYDRNDNPTGALLPTEITEFTNSGLMCGMATVNFSRRPTEEFVGFYGACSTYGSFSYLKYGLMRLFSQIAQDSDLKVGKVIWVAGHSGPETAEDSRTHFGIFAPMVTQLFPDGHVINIYPYEYNEVAPLLGAALAADAPIIALHLTRPAIEIPDRAALGMASHLDAARGAYVMRPYREDQPKGGVALVQGTSTCSEVVKLLAAGKLDEEGVNVKIVAVPSWDLFRRQPEEYRHAVLPEHEWLDATVIANCARRAMRDWLPHRWAEPFALTPDWDDRWRTGGSVDDIIDESHINARWIFEGLKRFAAERERRLGHLKALLERSL